MSLNKLKKMTKNQQTSTQIMKDVEILKTSKSIENTETEVTFDFENVKFNDIFNNRILEMLNSYFFNADYQFKKIDENDKKNIIITRIILKYTYKKLLQSFSVDVGIREDVKQICLLKYIEIMTNNDENEQIYLKLIEDGKRMGNILLKMLYNPIRLDYRHTYNIKDNSKKHILDDNGLYLGSIVKVAETVEELANSNMQSAYNPYIGIDEGFSTGELENKDIEDLKLEKMINELAIECKLSKKEKYAFIKWVISDGRKFGTTANTDYDASRMSKNRAIKKIRSYLSNC